MYEVRPGFLSPFESVNNNVCHSVTLTPDFTNTNTMPRGMLSFAKHSWRLGSVPAHWESANVDARWRLLLESGREIDSPMECHTPKHAEC
jgi:hypothetical protein